MSKIEVNQISSQCGSTLTIGQSGDTVTLAAGATAAGFGSTGEVSWDTTKKTTGFTAVSGVGYFCDTTSAAFTVTLPATPSAGNVVAVSDYAGTFNTNNLTIGRNSSNINGAASDFVINKNNVTAQFIYVDATQGWRVVFTGSQTGEGLQEGYICATGGTVTTCGNCKIHTFTGPGTFCVSSLACASANNVVSYMVVAGGGAGGWEVGGGGGAGGFREYKSPVTPYTASPLDGNPGGTAVTVSATSYPITVGAGAGPSDAGPVYPSPSQADNGSNSVFSTITSAGGGGAGNYNATPGANGGSGGGGAGLSSPSPGGTGNTPPVSPAQGTNGGTGSVGPQSAGGGGGGATVAGSPATSITGPADRGPRAAGATTSISGSPVEYAQGGRGSSDSAPGPCGSAGGANTGTGGDGGGASPVVGFAGGSGIVIIRYKYQ